MARPKAKNPQNVQITVKVSEPMNQVLQTLADTEGRPVSNMLKRLVIERALADGLITEADVKGLM